MDRKLLSIASALIVGCIGSVTAANYAGDATYYYQMGAYGSCGSISADTDYIAALSAKLQGTNKAQCGKCILVTGPKGNSIKVRVVDTCPECATGAIDLSTSAFGALADMGAGRISVSWDFVDCSSSASPAAVQAASEQVQPANSGTNSAAGSSTTASSQSPTASTAASTSSSSAVISNSNQGTTGATASQKSPSTTSEGASESSKADTSTNDSNSKNSTTTSVESLPSMLLNSTIENKIGHTEHNRTSEERGNQGPKNGSRFRNDWVASGLDFDFLRNDTREGSLSENVRKELYRICNANQSISFSERNGRLRALYDSVHKFYGDKNNQTVRNYHLGGNRAKSNSLNQSFALTNLTSALPFNDSLSANSILNDSLPVNDSHRVDKFRGNGLDDSSEVKGSHHKFDPLNFDCQRFLASNGTDAPVFVNWLNFAEFQPVSVNMSIDVKESPSSVYPGSATEMISPGQTNPQVMSSNVFTPSGPYTSVLPKTPKCYRRTRRGRRLNRR